jgi:hypothetical protein
MRAKMQATMRGVALQFVSDSTENADRYIRYIFRVK